MVAVVIGLLALLARVMPATAPPHTHRHTRASPALTRVGEHQTHRRRACRRRRRGRASRHARAAEHVAYELRVSVPVIWVGHDQHGVDGRLLCGQTQVPHRTGLRELREQRRAEQEQESGKEQERWSAGLRCGYAWMLRERAS